MREIKQNYQPDPHNQTLAEEFYFQVDLKIIWNTIQHNFTDSVT